jgi:hypothetical protein
MLFFHIWFCQPVLALSIKHHGILYDQRLPAKYLPTFHANYENRARDMDDSIPKFQTYPPNNEMNHDGTVKDN